MGEEMKQKMLQAVKNNLNVPGLMNEIIDGAVNDALDKLVKDTKTPFDDVAKAALYPTLSAEVKKQIELAWGKLFA